MGKLTKEERRKLKSFSLVSKEDFIFYLQELIVKTDMCIVWNRRYLLQLETEIKEKLTNNPNRKTSDIAVRYEIFLDYFHKINDTQTYLFNLIGDNQKISMSYNKFRNLAEKRKENDSLICELNELNAEEKAMLSRFNKVRNYSNHVPESILTAQRKLVQENERTESDYDPITINYPNYCTLEFVQDYYD